jgi:hypothetical protein
MFPFTELRGWLEQAGFENVKGYGRDGEPLTITILGWSSSHRSRAS